MTYLGQTTVSQDESSYAGLDRSGLVLSLIYSCGQTDGSHHKAWVLDQIVRILNGAELTFSKREWSDSPPEYDMHVGSSPEYEDWVKDYRGEYDEDYECFEYDYDVGIPP